MRAGFVFSITGCLLFHCLWQRVSLGGAFRVINGYAYLGVCTAIIQIPFVFEVNHSFDKDGAVYILPAFLEAVHRTEERFVKTGDEAGRFVGIEKSLSGSIDVGGVAFVSSSRMVLSVVEKDDPFWGVDSRRSTFGQMAVEISVAGRE